MNLIHSERGNALFLILIAVVLFGALGFAVTQSNRGGASLTKEQILLDAALLPSRVAVIRSTVQRLVLSATDPSAIDIVAGDTGNTYCTTGINCIFAPEGGGLIVDTGIPSTVWTGVGPGAVVFHEVGQGFDHVGTPSTSGDIVSIYTYLTLDACEEINKGFGLTATPVVDTTPLDSSIDIYQGESDFCYEFGAASGIYNYMSILYAQ